MTDAAQPSPETVIAFRDVSKRFGQTVAVDRVSFSVGAGETVSLLGPSGCGKTTTLRLISGFEDPDEGVIEIAGESMVGKRPYERNVGLLFQHYALFPHMTVAENIAYGLKHRRWPKAEIGERVDEMLRLVQLQGFGDRRPGQMSGGQQQRVALARVLATRPKLVLLDEPLSALDAKLREELRVELKQILAAVGSTTIVVTHDQDEAMSLADRIIVMNRGRIEQQGTPDEIYARPLTPFVAAFIGRANWFHGRIAAAAGEGLCQLATDAGTMLAIPHPGGAGGGSWSACIRPERVVVMALGAAGGAGENRLPGQIVDVVNMGAELHYIVDGAEGRLMAVEPNRAGPRVRRGDRVQLLFRADDCVVLPRKPD
ncbi:MAG TPA: ABC transporter ATP-binding protein [Alphaproteobacteria bacterium]|nr:ABC transporter ATP-binding protein [Alphaproteobacteria bacterium]